jgi:hypothetical protein
LENNDKEVVPETYKSSVDSVSELAADVTDETIPTSSPKELAAAEPNDVQGAGVHENGQYSVSSRAASSDVGEEYAQHDHGSSRMSSQIGVPSSHDTANGASPSTSTTAAENDAPHSEKGHEEHLSKQGPQLSRPGSVPESSLNNGYHPPIPMPVGHSVSAPPPRSFNSVVPLHEHLLQLAATKEGADWAIQVNLAGAQPFLIYAHSMMLFRSMRLRRLMGRPQNANYAGNMINLYPPRYVLPHAFEAALRFLYSDTVLANDFFVQPHAGPDSHAARLHNLDYILSYWVASIELGLEPVAVCAERLLSTYLDWDVLEITYKHAMDLANSPMSVVGKNMTGSDYLVASNSVVRLILQFLAARLDMKNFQLDTDSATTLFPPRLPSLDEGRPKPNPALATMVFGSMPSSAGLSPSSSQSEMLPTASTFRDTVASTILLNVDFDNLILFNNLAHARRASDAGQLMAHVVSEREARRLKILASPVVSNKDRMANSTAWEPVGMKESLTGSTLSRERVGFLLSSK